MPMAPEPTTSSDFGITSPNSGSEGVFLYRVNDEGKILSLRAFWEHERPRLEGDIHPPVGRER